MNRGNSILGCDITQDNFELTTIVKLLTYHTEANIIKKNLIHTLNKHLRDLLKKGNLTYTMYTKSHKLYGIVNNNGEDLIAKPLNKRGRGRKGKGKGKGRRPFKGRTQKRRNNRRNFPKRKNANHDRMNIG
jgi:hypothetical protein